MSKKKNQKQINKQKTRTFLLLLLFFVFFDGGSFSAIWRQTQEVAKDDLKLLILQPQPQSAGIICIMPSNFDHFYFIYQQNIA